MNNSHFLLLDEDANPFAIVNKNFRRENIIDAIEDEMGEPVDSVSSINEFDPMIVGMSDLVEFKATTNGVTRMYFMKPIWAY